jgi:hypothetical protein
MQHTNQKNTITLTTIFSTTMDPIDLALDFLDLQEKANYSKAVEKFNVDRMTLWRR